MHSNHSHNSRSSRKRKGSVSTNSTAGSKSSQRKGPDTEVLRELPSALPIETPAILAAGSWTGPSKDEIERRQSVKESILSEKKQLHKKEKGGCCVMQ